MKFPSRVSTVNDSFTFLSVMAEVHPPSLAHKRDLIALGIAGQARNDGQAAKCAAVGLENQRIKSQIGKQEKPRLADGQMGDFPQPDAADRLLHLGQKLPHVKGQYHERLEMQAQVLVG